MGNKKLKALLIAPMGSVHCSFNTLNIEVLQSMHYKVYLVANFADEEVGQKKNSRFVNECKENGIVTHSFPLQRHSLKSVVINAKKIRKLIIQEDITLVHTHTETGGLLLRLIGRIKDCHYIYTPHGMSFYQGSSLKSQLIYRPIEKWICNGMDKNIAINGEEYNVLKKWDSSKAYWVHGIGLDLSRFKNLDRTICRNKIIDEFKIPENSIIVTSVGELNDNKNHGIIIKSLSECNKNFFYIICGIGKNKEYLCKLAKTHNVNVILAGYRTDIPEILKASDIFAFPSFHEGLPVSVMEAMAAELPIICSNIRGNVDLINQNQGGYLVNPNNKEEFINAFENLLDNKSRECFGKYNRTLIDNYSSTKVREELEKIYVI